MDNTKVKLHINDYNVPFGRVRSGVHRKGGEARLHMGTDSDDDTAFTSVLNYLDQKEAKRKASLAPPPVEKPAPKVQQTKPE